MIQRHVFINKLRDLGYHYRDQSDRMQLYRKRGGTHEVTIRRKENPLSDKYVESVLKQCGLSEADARTFIGQNHCPD